MGDLPDIPEAEIMAALLDFGVVGSDEGVAEYINKLRQSAYERGFRDGAVDAWKAAGRE